MRLALAVTLAVPLAAPARADDPIRYVVAQKSGAGWTMWTNGSGPNACAAALLAASRQRQNVVGQTCDSLLGVKMTVGTADPGTQVERLESRECREMVQVRVLGGPLKGEVGCLPGGALTSLKPEATP
jgi:hypothetical protein